MTERNPQAEQMNAESMIRTLVSQVRCIWPQEQALFARYSQPQRILDVGCGTGEFMARLAEHYPQAEILGIELNPDHVIRARKRCQHFGKRITINNGDAFALAVPQESMDLVVCRHVLQSIPEPEKVVQQCQKALKRGGWLHLLVEDYTMIHFEGKTKFDRFWHDGPVQYGLETSCDLRIGRRGISLLEGFGERRLDYIVVDTERVSRDEFANIFIAWRDGYSEVVAPYLGWSIEQVEALWNEMIAIINNGYAVWQVPIASGRKK